MRGTQIADLVAQYDSKALRGLMVVHLTKRLPSQPRDWIGCQDPYNEKDDVFAPPPHAPTYGIKKAVQLALSQLRTDLDTFTNDEAYTLMAAGYAMTCRELPMAMPDLARARAPHRAAQPAQERRERLARLRRRRPQHLHHHHDHRRTRGALREARRRPAAPRLIGGSASSSPVNCTACPRDGRTAVATSTSAIRPNVRSRRAALNSQVLDDIDPASLTLVAAEARSSPHVSGSPP